jgi:hypothetical protein
MRFQDLSESSRTLIGEFQTKRYGSLPVGVLGLATALAMRAPLVKIDTSTEYGASRSLVIKRNLEKECGPYYRDVLDKFLDFVPFDFKLVLDATGDLYNLRYLLAFDTEIFINFNYRMNHYIENHFSSYISLVNTENVAKEFMKTLIENGGTVSYIANLFDCFINDLEKASGIKLNKTMDAEA